MSMLHNVVILLVVFSTIGLIVYLFRTNRASKLKKMVDRPLSDSDIQMLNDRVVFYSKLTAEEKQGFEKRMV